MVAVLEEAEPAALELLGVEVDRAGEAAISHARQRVVAVTDRLAAALALVAADAENLALGDLVLETLVDRGQQAPFQPGIDKGVGLAGHDAVVDPVLPTVVEDAHLVVADPRRRFAVPGLQEGLTLGHEDTDEL